jgi:hypothetical protein
MIEMWCPFAMGLLSVTIPSNEGNFFLSNPIWSFAPINNDQVCEKQNPSDEDL